MLLTFPPKCPPPQNTGFIIVRLEYEKEENPCNVLNRSAGFCKTTVSWDIVPSDNSYRCKVKIVDNEIHSALGNQLFLSFGALCFSHPKFRFWFLVTFGDEVTKIWKYYEFFVYILQSKMGKTEKNWIENNATKLTKIPKTKRQTYGMNET